MQRPRHKNVKVIKPANLKQKIKLAGYFFAFDKIQRKRKFPDIFIKVFGTIQHGTETEMKPMSNQLEEQSQQQNDCGKGSSVGMDVALKSMICELYSRDISTKIRSANKVRWEKGEYLGTVPFYGYKLSETVKNQLVIDEAAAQVVKRIFQMAVYGINPNEIAVILNQEKVPTPLAYRENNGTHLGRGWTAVNNRRLWTRFSVKHILCDERFTGKLISYKRTKADVASKRKMNDLRLFGTMPIITD